MLLEANLPYVLADYVRTTAAAAHPSLETEFRLTAIETGNTLVAQKTVAGLINEIRKATKAEPYVSKELDKLMSMG